MPNPNNRLKLTGDTHLHDIDDMDFDTDIDDVAMDARAEPMAQTFSPSSHATAPSGQMQSTLGGMGDSVQGYAQAAREQVRNKPMATLGGAFALGFVLAKLFR
jgi:hypothetical protein